MKRQAEANAKTALRWPPHTHLVVGLCVHRGTPLGALQGLLHLLHLHGQVRLEVAAQGHAGVLGRLAAGEDLVVREQGSLVLRVQDLQGADLQGTRRGKGSGVRGQDCKVLNAFLFFHFASNNTASSKHTDWS